MHPTTAGVDGERSETFTHLNGWAERLTSRLFTCRATGEKRGAMTTHTADETEREAAEREAGYVVGRARYVAVERVWLVNGSRPTSQNHPFEL